MNDKADFEGMVNEANPIHRPPRVQGRGEANREHVAILAAQDRPRDVQKAIAAMREACQMPALAEVAFYTVDRMGQKQTSGSIHLARELARVFTNISYGVWETERDDVRTQSVMTVYARDLESNTGAETTFIIPHRRDTKLGPRTLQSFQEIYEHNASFAARRLREVIFSVLPKWFVEEAQQLCEKTLSGGGSRISLTQRIADLRHAFFEIGVSQDQLEQMCGRRLSEFTPADLATLRVTYGEISRGEVRKDAAFPRAGQPGDALPRDADPFERAGAGVPARDTDPATTAK